MAADLDALGLATTSDLLRMNPAGLMHRRPALKGPKVMRWVLYANLMEIDGMTLDVAHSLVDGGISGLDELHGATLSRLQAIVPSVPADDVVDWMRDALRLTLTGVVNGTVTLRDGTPVEGAGVTVGGLLDDEGAIDELLEGLAGDECERLCAEDTVVVLLTPAGAPAPPAMSVIHLGDGTMSECPRTPGA